MIYVYSLPKYYFIQNGEGDRVWGRIETDRLTEVYDYETENCHIFEIKVEKKPFKLETYYDATKPEYASTKAAFEDGLRAARDFLANL